MSLVAGTGLTIAGRLAQTDLHLEAGNLTCLVGPNGSGKTSLLHALAGIGDAKGQVRIAGIDLRAASASARPRLMTYLPASREMRWPLQARDLIALGGADGREVDDAMVQLDLAGVADRPLDRLSTGERSRVLIARAIATKPKLLLLDEPTSNLDPLWQIRLMQLVKAQVAENGRAALVAMHDLDAAARYADRLIVMSAGRIAADDAPGDVLAGPVVAEVFGVERVAGAWQPVSEARRQSSQ